MTSLSEIDHHVLSNSDPFTICRQDTHSQHTSVQNSLFTSAERIARAWLKSSRIAFHFCAPQKNLSSGVAHVSSSVVVSFAFLHEHYIFLFHSSFYDTRTRSTIGTSRTSPRLPQSTSCAIRRLSKCGTRLIGDTIRGTRRTEIQSVQR